MTLRIQIDSNIVGVALVVSNDIKDKNILFAHDDADKIEEMFKSFRYAVYRKKNITHNEFVSFIGELADYTYPPTCKRILLYFSGHGSDGELVMQDGNTIKVNNIVARFTTDLTKSKTVPQMVKMFFLDMCRGELEDFGFTIVSKGDEVNQTRKIPKEGSMLIAYSSTTNHMSYGSTDSGSGWTNCFIQALKDSKESDDVCYVLTKANKLMKEKNQIESLKMPKEITKFQTAEFSSSLAEFVCFKKEAKKT